MKNSKANFYDVIVIGAGAAGLFCAREAASRGKSVLVLEHQKKIGSKILISGGGRCNFTNRITTPDFYRSENLHFMKSALARFSPQDFIGLVEEYKIDYYEKKLGQLFCKNSAKEIVNMLEAECKKYEVNIKLGVEVHKIEKVNPQFKLQIGLDLELSFLYCNSLVIATGGLSVPKIGATDFGYAVAKQFGLKIVETKPALDGFVLEDAALRELSGISLDVLLSAGTKTFREKILITHHGFSGPAALQGSLYWDAGESIEIDLLPDQNLEEILFKERKVKNKQQLANFLAQFFPKRFADYFLTEVLQEDIQEFMVSELSNALVIKIAQAIHHWKFSPLATVGYTKAEVTRGGVSTDELSSQTMECKKVKGLYFIGEVVDVTGALGGYNFHWAWASAWVAGQSL